MKRKRNIRTDFFRIDKLIRSVDNNWLQGSDPTVCSDSTFFIICQIFGQVAIDRSMLEIIKKYDKAKKMAAKKKSFHLALVVDKEQS